MSGADIPKFSHEEPDPSSRPDVFMGLYELDVSDKLQALQKALDSDRRADFVSYRFGFYDQGTLDTIQVPEQIASLEKRYGSLTSIAVECTSPIDCDAISFDVSFDFRDNNRDDNQIARLTVKRPFDYVPDQDAYDEITLCVPEEFEDDDNEEESYVSIEHITPMSRSEFNCLLASLVYRSDNISIDAFSSFNWHSESFEKTIANFNCVAEYTIRNEEFLVKDDTNGLAGVVRVNHYDDTITDIQLDRITNHDMFIDTDGNFCYEKRLIETWVTPSADPTISFWSCEERGDDDPVWEEMTPKIDDYNATITFIESQLRRIHPTQLEQFDDDTTQPPEDY